ncbi:MAG: aldose 1-epimerase family protein [Oscillospiraceae bacterium]|nr:aldose 1-epimerase family protein [Oscillospiraceae bacterium]
MITIQNKYLTATFNTLGAELKSLTMEGTEYIWPGHPDIWKSSCPLLFPICGGLKEDKYTYQGVAYSLPRHGFARTREFAVESQSETQVVFLLVADEATKAVYPFDFELRVQYTLEEKSLHICCNVKNKGQGPMYFSIGSHEGYFTPEGVEDYDVLFPNQETLNTYVLNGPILSAQQMPIIKEQNYLPIYEKYFMIDTLVFKDLVSRSATLRNRKTGRAIRVDFPDCDYFMIWHKPGAPYLCLEPWAGVADIQGTSFAIEEKEGINCLASGAEYTNTHSITVL